MVSAIEASPATSSGSVPALSASSTWPPASRRQPWEPIRSSSKPAPDGGWAEPMRRGCAPICRPMVAASASTPGALAGERSAVRQRIATSVACSALVIAVMRGSPAFPLRLALLEECGHALDDVLG